MPESLNISNSGTSQVKQHAKTDNIRVWQSAAWGKYCYISFQERSTKQRSEGVANSSHKTKLAVVLAISKQIITAELLWMLKSCQE